MWIRFGVTHLTALGGTYAIGVVLALAVLSGGLRSLGIAGFAGVLGGLAIGAVLGLVLGTADGYVVRQVGPERLRTTVSVVNGVLTVIVMAVLGTALGATGWFAAAVLYLGPGLAVALVTWRRSPEARRIHG